MLKLGRKLRRAPRLPEIEAFNTQLEGEPAADLPNPRISQVASVKKLPRDRFRLSNLEVEEAMHQNSYFQEILAQERAEREAYTKKKKTNEVKRKLVVDRQIQNFQVLPTNQATIQDVSRPSPLAKVPPAEALENVLGPSADDLILEETQSLLAQRRIPGQVVQHIQELTPQELDIQLEISRSRSVQTLLNLVGLHQEKLDAINLAAIVHRLGKLSTDFQKRVVTRDDRFLQLVQLVKGNLPNCRPLELSSLLWGFVRLDFPPPFLEDLLGSLEAQVSALDVYHIGGVLYCLSRVKPLMVEPVQQLENLLIGGLETHFQENPDTHGWGPLELVSLLTSLARLQRRHEQILSSICRAAQTQLGAFEPEDISSFLWAMGQLRVSDGRLIESFQNVLIEQVASTPVPNLLTAAGALQRLRSPDRTLFLQSCAPVFRSHLPSLSARDLATLLGVYAQGNLVEPEFFGDTAKFLQKKTRDMTPADFAVALPALAPLASTSAALIREFVSGIKLTLARFRADQLVRVFGGLSQASEVDPLFFRRVFDEILLKRASLQPRVLVDLLVGLGERGQSDWGQDLLEDVWKQVPHLFGDDLVKLLSVVPEFPGPRDCDLLFSGLIKHCATRHWQMSVSSMALFLEALQDLQLKGLVQPGNPLVHQLMDSVLIQLPRVLKSGDPLDFLRVLAALSDFEKTPLIRRIRAEIHKNPRLGQVMNAQISKLVLTKDLEGEIMLLLVAAKLGFDCQVLFDLSGRLLTDFQEDEFQTPSEKPPLNLELASLLVYANVEFQWHTPDTRDLLRRLLRQPEGWAPLSLDGLVRLSHACVFLNEGCSTLNDEPLLADLLNELGSREFPPSALVRLAQPVALHMQLSSHSSGLNEPARKLMDLLLKFPLERSVRRSWGKKGEDPNYTQWVSDTLVNLKVPHKTQYMVEIYEVPLGFPSAQHCVDIVGPHDVLSPSLRVGSQALLRQRQLAQLGWVVHSIHLKDLHEAIKNSTLRQWLTSQLGALLPPASDPLAASEEPLKLLKKIRPPQ